MADRFTRKDTQKVEVLRLRAQALNCILLAGKMTEESAMATLTRLAVKFASRADEIEQQLRKL